MNANHAMLTTLVGSLLASGAILAFTQAPGIDAPPVAVPGHLMETTEAALEPASLPVPASQRLAPLGCPACGASDVEPPQVPLSPEVTAPTEPAPMPTEVPAAKGQQPAGAATTDGGAPNAAQPSPETALPGAPEAAAPRSAPPATPYADAPETPQAAPPALPEAPRGEKRPREQGDSARDMELERTIVARLQSPGATTPGIPATEVDVPGATLPQTCGLPACQEEASFPGADIATPGIESIPLATEDTHVEETRVGPARVDAFDLQTGAHLGSTPEVAEGEAHVPAAGVDPACSFAGEACLDEQRVNGTRVALDGVPAQRVPGARAWARVDAGAWFDADGAQLHEVEPYRYGVDEIYVGGCDKGCRVMGPSAGYHHAHAYGIDEA